MLEVLSGEITSALMECVPLTVSDSVGTIVFANDAFCVLTQYTCEELLGQRYRMISSGYHSVEFFREMWETITGGRTWKGEIRNRTKDGSYCCVDTTIVPLPDASGKPHQYLATYADITAIRKLQESLHESNRRYQDLVRIAPDGMFLSEDGLTTFVNEAGVKEWRARSPEDIVGRTTYELFHPNCHDSIRKRTETLLKEPGSVPADEETLLALDGTEIPVEVRAVSFLQNGRLAILSACRDISERKRTERQLREERDYAEAVINSLPGVFITSTIANTFYGGTKTTSELLATLPKNSQACISLTFLPKTKRSWSGAGSGTSSRKVSPRSRRTMCSRMDGGFLIFLQVCDSNTMVRRVLSVSGLILRNGSE